MHEPAGEERKGNRTDQRHKEKYPYNLQRRSACQQRLQVRINVNLDATVQGANQGGGVVIGDKTVVTSKSRSVVEYTCHTESRNNISRTDQDVALPATSLMTDCVSISLNLEQKTFELLNRPATVGVNVEVEDTSVSGIVLSTSNSVGVDGTNNFAVDFCQDLSAENVGQFGLELRP